MEEKLAQYFFKVYNPDFQQLGIVLHEIILGLDENIQPSLKWNMPAYDLNGLCFGLGVFKHKVTLFFHRGVEMKDPLGWFAGQEENKAMRSIQFKSIDDIDGENLELYLANAIAIAKSGKVKTKKKSAPKPLPEMPSSLALELNRNSIANEFYNSLSNPNKREYLVWISSAKREETVKSRIEKTIKKLEHNQTCWAKYKLKR